MRFILICVLILLVFSFVVYVMKAIARLSNHLRGAIKDVKEIREQKGGRPVASAEMAPCAQCGAFISARDAVTVSSRGGSRVFCSSDCARAHIAR